MGVTSPVDSLSTWTYGSLLFHKGVDLVLWSDGLPSLVVGAWKVWISGSCQLRRVWLSGIHNVLVMSGVGVVIRSKVLLHIVCQCYNVNLNAKGLRSAVIQY